MRDVFRVPMVHHLVDRPDCQGVAVTHDAAQALFGRRVRAVNLETWTGSWPGKRGMSIKRRDIRANPGNPWSTSADSACSRAHRVCTNVRILRRFVHAGAARLARENPLALSITRSLHPKGANGAKWRGSTIAEVLQFRAPSGRRKHG